MTIYILETYGRGSTKEPVAYTAQDKEDAVRIWDNTYEGEPYQIEVIDGTEYARIHFGGELEPLASLDVFEEWKYFLCNEHGVYVRYYDSLDDVKKELDKPTGWLTHSITLKARVALEKLYNDNKT